MANTISFDEKNNGWTSFWDYNPEWMERLGRSFYTFKNGQLYRHHSETSQRNQFYNEAGNIVSVNSSIKTVFNQAPSDIKHFKSISLESSSGSWNLTFNSNLDSGHISQSDLDNREGKYYSYIRRNNNILDLDYLSVQGLGNVTNVTGYTYTFNSLPSFLSEEDTFCYYNGSTLVVVGKIISFTDTQISVTIPIIPVTVPNGSFCVVAKNAAAESYGLKGYYSFVELTTSSSSPESLFSINAELFKSFQ